MGSCKFANDCKIRINVPQHSFDKSKPYPAWLNRDDLENKNSIRGQKYYRHRWNAQPNWADVDRIEKFYRERDCRNARDGAGVWEVDHIYPLIHEELCGLHNQFNLQVVKAKLNRAKGNLVYPGMETSQIDFWSEELEQAIHETNGANELK